MTGFGDRFGAAGFIEQLFLWNTVSQVVSALMTPAFTVLLQDAQKAHPEQVLTPDQLAQLVVRHLAEHGPAEADAAKSGIDPARFAQLVEAATVRLQPADLATLVLRARISPEAAEAQARPQGLDAEQMRLLTYLAGDALGPEQLAEAARRGIIDRHGRGEHSTSYDQGIAESRLDPKWGPALFELTRMLASPPQLAEAVVRHFTGREDAIDQAAKVGTDEQLLDLLILLAGDAPGPQQLAEALRRHLIPRDGTGPDVVSFAQGIAESRLANKYAPMIEGLAQLWPTPTDALHAEVEGQLSHDEATELYARLGGNPEFQQWLFDTIGEGPTPLEAAILAARGIIPWHGTGPKVTSYEQAVRESRYRNKWAEPYKRLAEHVPPPSTVAMWRAHQTITQDEANDLLLQADMAPANAARYLAEAAFERVSDYRGLQESAVLDMYANRLLDAGQVRPILAALHVDPAAIDLELQYADMRYLIDSINRSVQRIAQLFTGRKIGSTTARDALLKLKIPAATVDLVIEQWELQAQADVKTLTPAQIVDAWHYQVFTDAEAMTELEAIGYTPFDAWALLSIKNKTPVPGKPKHEVAAPPGTVIPGTT